MKKIAFVFIAALSLGLVACDTTAKKPIENQVPATVVDSTTVEKPVEVTLSASELLKKYETTVKQLIPALVSMQKGEKKALNEYQKLSMEISEMMPALQSKMGEMNDKEKAKFKEIADMLYKATNPNAPKEEKKK